jgi:plasmid stabilization system protein ParE
MSKPIIWSGLSVKDFESILDYLQSQWGENVMNQFIEVVDKLILQISINPKQFPFIHKSKKVRKCVLNKYNTLFYREMRGRVDILRIYDTRQSPKKLKFQ